MLLLTRLSLTFKSQAINNRLGGYPAAHLPSTLLPLVGDVKAQLGREILTACWPLIRIQSGLSGVRLSGYWFNFSSSPLLGTLSWVAFCAFRGNARHWNGMFSFARCRNNLLVHCFFILYRLCLFRTISHAFFQSTLAYAFFWFFIETNSLSLTRSV